MTKRLAKLKRSATKEDSLIELLSPLSPNEIVNRNKDYTQEGDKVRNKPFKLVFLIISISIFCYHIFNIVSLWATIPESIAIHFTNNTPNNWGSKYTLLLMPILSIFVWFLIDLLVKKPERMNYVNLTEANKEIQFARAEKVMILIQNFSFLFFILANESFLRNTVGMESNIPFVISLTLLALCFIAPIYFLIWAATLKY